MIEFKSETRGNFFLILGILNHWKSPTLLKKAYFTVTFLTELIYVYSMKFKWIFLQVIGISLIRTFHPSQEPIGGS